MRIIAKNKSIKILLFILPVCLLWGCQANYEHRDAAIAVHDEIMPKMEPFVQKSMQIDTLLSHLDSLYQLDSSLDTLQLQASLKSAKAKITEANDAMHAWMHDFELEPEGDRAAVEAYFLEQKSKIDVVKQRYLDTENLLKSIDHLN